MSTLLYRKLREKIPRLAISIFFSLFLFFVTVHKIMECIGSLNYTIKHSKPTYST